MSPKNTGLLDADTRRYLHQLIKLVEISLTLNSTKEPEELLQSIINTATDLLDCEAASILLYDQGTKNFTLLRQPVPIRKNCPKSLFRVIKALLALYSGRKNLSLYLTFTTIPVIMNW